MGDGGAGHQHSDVPLAAHRRAPNPLELFQVWLNHRAPEDGGAALHHAVERGAFRAWRTAMMTGRLTTVTVVAGACQGRRAAGTAARILGRAADADVAIWTLHLAPGAQWVPPAAAARARGACCKILSGGGLRVGRRTWAHAAMELVAGQDWAHWRTPAARPWNACCCRAAPSASQWRSTARS